MKIIPMEKYRLKTDLTDFMPLPRELMKLRLHPQTVLLYALLLDRGTLSQKNDYADEEGWVYVIYTVEDLAKDLGVNFRTIHRNLNILEERGLIQRKRPTGNLANLIFLNIPALSRMSGPTCQERHVGVSPMSGPTCHECHTNELRKQTEINNSYYQHNQEESL